jgi:hypothetical protein
MECRFLSPPTPSGDPMRTDGDGRVLHPCPSCGETAWADLRNVDLRRAVGELDAAEDNRRSSFWSGAVLYALALAACSAGIWLVGTRATLLGTIGAAICFAPVLLAPLLSGALARRVGKSARRNTPVRWHRPFARAPRKRGPSVTGPAAALGGGQAPAPLLTSPLTGRPCLAYEVGVRLDDDADAPDATWQLLDQRNVALKVGPTAVEADRAWVTGQRHRLDPPAHAVRDYLLQNGLDPDLEHYVFFEIVVEPGTSCRVWSSGLLVELASP